MVIVYRKGQMRARTMIEFEMGLYDRMYCQSRDSGQSIREIVDRCVRAGIDQISRENLEEQKKELELGKKYGQK